MSRQWITNSSEICSLVHYDYLNQSGRSEVLLQLANRFGTAAIVRGGRCIVPPMPSRTIDIVGVFRLVDRLTNSPVHPVSVGISRSACQESQVTAFRGSN